MCNGMDYGIHWFRRDLRVAGNAALQKQHLKHKGHVLGLFCFDKKFLSRPDFSVNRFQFFIHTLVSLRQELRQMGSDLLVLDEGPLDAFPELIRKLKKHKRPLPTTISLSRDYEPFAVKRDKQFSELLNALKIDYFTERDHLLIEPTELEKSPGKGYQVYTPFSKRWLALFQETEFQNRIRHAKKSLAHLRKLEKGSLDKIFKLTWKELFKGHIKYPDHLNSYAKQNGKKVDVPIPAAGALPAWASLKAFRKKLDQYGNHRDSPSTSGTSKLSLYFKNGTLTLPQVIAYLELKPYRTKSTSRAIYLSELIWREFYYHILARHPRIEKEAFLEKYTTLKWKNNPRWFRAWKEGNTGFPIVDAGMRQLNTTGWMHNRVRMIVASFLTKDLLIDWRWGEKYFMEKLLDGDLAPNNGGWQWAASTGCDPQPYFRIFNPWLQSQKFDPEGLYIKSHVSELKEIPSKQLHEPILGHPTYPEPIVDHRTQKEEALLLFGK